METKAVNIKGKKKMEFKVLNDPIHGIIELHPLLVKIIDTPQFQRLRFIKQLGGGYFVYPGASHNRFEHSIGVCHLAGRFVRALKDKQSKALKNVDITPVDELCVQIAALCHDLGHGPFSHVFDSKIIPKIKDTKWKHEKGSKDMLDYMLEVNEGLKNEFKNENLKVDGEASDITFIKELIDGPKNKEDRKGRGREKWFLYEIVSNKRNKIDVDKWDYFARDCHMMGIGNNFNLDRLIAFSRVNDVDGEKQICYRDKHLLLLEHVNVNDKARVFLQMQEATNLYDMFHIRNLLHQRAYQHKTKSIVEIMLAEALVSANKYLTFEGKEGPVGMSDAIDDMKAYTLLNDGVIQRILESDKKELENSQEILKRILKRDIYRCVGEKRFPAGTFGDDKAVKEDIKKKLSVEQKCNDIISRLDESIIIDVVHFDYGNGAKDPIASVNFYTKRDRDSAKPRKKDEVSLLLPNVFSEQAVRVYCKKQDDYEDVKKMFDEWSSKETEN